MRRECKYYESDDSIVQSEAFVNMTGERVISTHPDLLGILFPTGVFRWYPQTIQRDKTHSAFLLMNFGSSLP